MALCIIKKNPSFLMLSARSSCQAQGTERNYGCIERCPYTLSVGRLKQRVKQGKFGLEFIHRRKGGGLYPRL